MKKILLSIFTLSFLMANSQFIIDKGDFANQGDVIIYATDSSFADNTDQLDISGDNVVWDYRSLIAFSLDTMYFQDPAIFDAANALPNATITYNQDVYQNFLEINSNEVKYAGYSTLLATLIDTSLLPSGTNLPSDVVFKYNNGGLPYVNLDAEVYDTDNGTVLGKFTAFYGDTFNIPGLGDTYIDSFRVNEDVTYEYEIDGNGVLILPDSLDFYVLRQNINYKKDYTVEILINLSPIPGFPFWQWQAVPGIEFTIEERDYRFLGKYQKFPVLEIAIEANGAFTRSKYQLNPHGSQVSINKNLELDFNCFVSNNTLNIYSTEKISSLEIMDLTGKIIESISVDNKSFSTDFNYKGIYIIRVITDNNLYSTKVNN